jgi:hypothetical protein
LLIGAIAQSRDAWPLIGSQSKALRVSIFALPVEPLPALEYTDKLLFQTPCLELAVTKAMPRWEPSLNLAALCLTTPKALLYIIETSRLVLLVEYIMFSGYHV